MTDAPDQAAQRAYEERSWRELEAGRLPLRAQERLAAMEADHAFTSDLSAAEHLAVRAAGFEPVGQVMGASVFQIGYTGGWDCGISGGLGGMRTGPFGVRTGPYGMRGGYGTGGFNTGGFSGRGMAGGSGTAGVGMYGQNITCTTVTVAPWQHALRQAQQLAMGRLEQEARALGGDGVVAVRFTENHLQNGAVEFVVIGTAVRAPGKTRAAHLFTSALRGQDLLRLLRAGWMPMHLLFGIACMTRHDDLATRWNQVGWSNVELAGYTQLVLDTRAEARRSLAREAATVGAEAAILEDTYERISEHECYLLEGGHDHVVRTTFVGTGLVELPERRGHKSSAPQALPILRLRDRPVPLERPGP